jgi:hypothetical protein
MTGPGFDTFTRQLGRRRALQAFGAAAVATASGLTLADAKNGNNKRKNKQQKKKTEQKALALCESQVQECTAVLGADCENDAECLARSQQCCQFLATCDFSGLVTCTSGSTENL